MRKFIISMLLFMCVQVNAQMFFSGSGALPLPPQSITISLPRIAGPLPQPLMLPRGWENADLIDLGDNEFVRPAVYRRMMQAKSIKEEIESLPMEADFFKSYQDINLGNGENPNNPSELDPGFWQEVGRTKDYTMFRPVRDQTRLLKYYYQTSRMPARWEMTKQFGNGTRWWWNGWQKSIIQHIAGA